MNKDFLKKCGAGLGIGLVNGFFGSGGGIIAVLLLRKLGIDEKAAHATSVLLILPLSAVSAAVYFFSGGASFAVESLYIAAGACAGAAVGSLLLKKLSVPAVENIFSAAMLASGLWMLFR